MRKVLYLLIFGVAICSVITACGNNSDPGNKTGTAAVEKEDVSNAEVSEENVTDNNDQDSFPTEQTKKPEVSADYLDDVKALYPDYVDASEAMKVSSSEYETMVLFHTDGNVEDFRVYSLELNFDENGDVDYIPTEVFRSAELKKDTPIAVPLYFPGDMSLNGFCYKEPDGNEKTYTISISGKDGSLVINAENFAVPEQ